MTFGFQRNILEYKFRKIDRFTRVFFRRCFESLQISGVQKIAAHFFVQTHIQEAFSLDPGRFR